MGQSPSWRNRIPQSTKAPFSVFFSLLYLQPLPSFSGKFSKRCLHWSLQLFLTTYSPLSLWDLTSVPMAWWYSAHYITNGCWIVTPKGMLSRPSCTWPGGCRWLCEPYPPRDSASPGVQDTFYFCSFLTSTPAPAGVSNTHPWGLALGSALRGLPTLCPLPGAPLLPNGFSSSLHVHNSPGFLFQKTIEQICQGKYHISHIYNFNFSSSHILKEVTGKILIITIFNPHIQNITSSTCNQYKVMNKILHYPFPTKSSKFVLYTYSRSPFGLTTFQVHNSHMWLVPSYHIGWYRSRFWFPAVWNLEVPRREYVQNTGLFKGGAIWVWL